MKATVPRPIPNFRAVLQETPGWYMSRGNFIPRHSSELLASSKRFALWKKAEWLTWQGERTHTLYVNSDDDWFYCGNGTYPVDPWSGESIADRVNWE